MTVSKKIKTIDSKIKHNKAQYNLNSKTAIMSALLSRNVSKYEFLTGKYALPATTCQTKLLQSTKSYYSPLIKELKEQNNFSKKEYKGVTNVYEFDKKKDDKK